MIGEAEHDAAAAAIVERLAEEIEALARVALERLQLSGEHVEVVLGGGLIQAGDGRLVTSVAERIRRHAPAAIVRPVGVPPILGAALLALDELDADAAGGERLRSELHTRFAEVTKRPERSPS